MWPAYISILSILLKRRRWWHRTTIRICCTRTAFFVFSYCIFKELLTISVLKESSRSSVDRWEKWRSLSNMLLMWVLQISNQKGGYSYCINKYMDFMSMNTMVVISPSCYLHSVGSYIHIFYILLNTQGITKTTITNWRTKREFLINERKTTNKLWAIF